ncbi:MAG: hypothetical protein EXR86_12425 [Gammaproteobacteria bacterium]|nr:hypothetical protein [Gammaproteobacteria bacterium]
MATLATTSYTLLDWAKQIGPDEKPARIINLLSQTNEILLDMPVIEGNLATGHQSTQLTGLPVAAFRLLNQGVAESKDVNQQITDTAGMLEAWSKVDQAVADLNGATDQYRLNRAKTFLDAMNQTMASTIFYGNTAVNPERFLGLAPRYSLISAGNGTNIIDAGGTGSDNMSIWYIRWDEMTCCGFFPKGQADSAGLKHEDLGLETVYDASSQPFRAFRDHYIWKIGLAVPDWRYVVRIANIDVSNLVTVTGNADLINLMIRARGKVPSQTIGKGAFYMNAVAYTMLSILALNKSNAVLPIKNAVGQTELNFLGDPIRRCDALLTSEARVV